MDDIPKSPPDNVTPLAVKAIERNVEAIDFHTQCMMESALAILKLSQTENISGILLDNGVPTHVIEVRKLGDGEDPRKTWDLTKMHEVKQ